MPRFLHIPTGVIVERPAAPVTFSGDVDTNFIQEGTPTPFVETVERGGATFGTLNWATIAAIAPTPNTPEPASPGDEADTIMQRMNEVLLRRPRRVAVRRDDAFDPETDDEPDQEPEDFSDNSGPFIGGLEIERGLGDRSFVTHPGNQYRRLSDGMVFRAENGRWRGYIPEDRAMTQDLDVKNLPPSRSKLPPFKLLYSNIEEAQLRLNESIVMVRGRPFYVTDTVREKRDFMLYVKDTRNKTFKIPYSHPDLDMRSPPPGYIHSGPVVSFLVRKPERIYKQGLTSQTAQHKPVGTDRWKHFNSISDILRGIEGRTNRKWDGSIAKHVQEGLIHSLYLSEHIGVGRKAALEKTFVEYKGRTLGELQEDTVSLDPDDFDVSWIKNDLREVGINARSK